jgi:transposase InsO family protein
MTSSRSARRTAGLSACFVVLDEFTRRYLAIVVARRCAALPDRPLHPARSARAHSIGQWTGVRGDQRSRLARQSCKTLYIEPCSPWENGYCESLNSKLRDELLNGEIFTTLREAEVLIENWRRHYNAVRPHSSLGYRPPAPEAILPPAPGLPYAPLRSAQPLAEHGRILI